MAYRLHVVVSDGTRTLGAARLDRELAGLQRTVAVRGSRHGVQGLWLVRDRRADFRFGVDRLRRYAADTGYVFSYYATNEPSRAAVADLVPVRRG